jgi:DNA-binding transcriptional regulator LsrR (DeoR family)
MKIVDFTNEELSRIKELYYNSPLTSTEIADLINIEFHNCDNNVRNEDSIYIAMDILALSDEY